MSKLYALLSSQGTACSETVLTEAEYNFAWRDIIEAQYCHGGPDDPVKGSWTDVTENEACSLICRSESYL